MIKVLFFYLTEPYFSKHNLRYLFVLFFFIFYFVFKALPGKHDSLNEDKSASSSGNQSNLKKLFCNTLYSSIFYDEQSSIASVPIASTNFFHLNVLLLMWQYHHLQSYISRKINWKKACLVIVIRCIIYSFLCSLAFSSIGSQNLFACFVCHHNEDAKLATRLSRLNVFVSMTCIVARNLNNPQFITQWNLAQGIIFRHASY